MIFSVRVMPKASRKLVKEESDHLKVYLTKPAQDGLANAQLISLLAEYFKVRKYQVTILKGEASRNKLVQISDA